MRIGTSGYSYREWKGRFYPKDLPARRMLAHYAERFSAVEINNSFYELPATDVIEKWAAEVPLGFEFAFKAPGHITHQRRLGPEARDATAELWKTVETLGRRLGPVLFGLPANMKKDLPRLEAFLELLPRARRVAFEFRHESWFADDVYAALRARGVALCIADAKELSTPFEVTTDWGYLRLRRARYGPKSFDAWGAKIRAAGWTDAYVFFKHEDKATAPRYARALRTRFAGPARPDARAPRRGRGRS